VAMAAINYCQNLEITIKSAYLVISKTEKSIKKRKKLSGEIIKREKALKMDQTAHYKF
jgi:hypothetical protein